LDNYKKRTILSSIVKVLMKFMIQLEILLMI